MNVEGTEVYVDDVMRYSPDFREACLVQLQGMKANYFCNTSIEKYLDLKPQIA